MTRTRTSVLINNYNNGPYLRECIDSVLAQVPPADEVIVYDDGSNDSSLEILRSYGTRITLMEGVRDPARVSRANQANAIAQAFWRSTGELIFLLDGDDYFFQGKIARFLEIYESQPGIVMMQAPSQIIDPKGGRLGVRGNPLSTRADYKAITYTSHELDFYQPTSALAFSRGYLEKVLPLDYSDGINIAPDTRISIVAPLFGKVIGIDTPLNAWRRHANSHSVQNKIYMSDETRKRTRYFNAFCERHGFPPIKLWRNKRYYRQLARSLMPAFVGNWWHSRHLPKTHAA